MMFKALGFEKINKPKGCRIIKEAVKQFKYDFVRISLSSRHVEQLFYYICLAVLR